MRRRLWELIGCSVYWLTLPAIALVLARSQRTRLLLVCDGRVLVVRGWLSDGRWQLPGGGLHRGETPAAGARRELREETGLDLPLERLPAGQPRHRRQGMRRFHYQLFELELDDLPAVRPRWPELTDCRWLPVNQLTDRNASFDVLDAIAAK